MEETFSISTTLRTGLPRSIAGLPFKEVKEQVLGKRYDLSLSFIGSSLSRRLNATYRHKDKAANVLSFPLSEISGEILIDLSRAKNEAKKFEMSFAKFVLYLFIHGTLHLKGMDHGDTMERAEKKFLEQFELQKSHGKTNRRRH